VSQASWIAIASGAAGNGSGRVELTFAANAGDARAGTVVIAGHTFTATQAAATPACTYTLTPAAVTLAAAGGATAFDVATQSTCAWTAVSRAAWIAVTNNPNGSGNGRIELAVAANDGAARSGTVTVGTQSFTVNQDGIAAPSLSTRLGVCNRPACGHGSPSLVVGTGDADLARVAR
jgi:hypothetical protein